MEIAPENVRDEVPDHGTQPPTETPSPPVPPERDDGGGDAGQEGGAGTG